PGSSWGLPGSLLGLWRGVLVRCDGVRVSIAPERPFPQASHGGGGRVEHFPQPQGLTEGVAQVTEEPVNLIPAGVRGVGADGPAGVHQDLQGGPDVLPGGQVQGLDLVVPPQPAAEGALPWPDAVAAGDPVPLRAG